MDRVQGSTSNVERIEQQRREQQGIFQTWFAKDGGGSFEYAPVASSTYQTIDFRNNPDCVISSDRLMTNVALIIKNKNPETGKYDNVATMANFYPNNAYNLQTTQANLRKVLKSYQDAGGQLSSDTSIQLFGGVPRIIEETMGLSSIRQDIFEALNSPEVKTVLNGATVKQHAGKFESSNPQAESITAVITKDGTQINKIKKVATHPSGEQTISIDSLTKSLPRLGVRLQSGLMKHDDYDNLEVENRISAWERSVATKAVSGPIEMTFAGTALSAGRSQGVGGRG